MPFGVNGFWLLTWSLWGVVVYLDWRREPRDWRWIVSLGAMLVVASVTHDSLNSANLRFVLLSGLAMMVISAWGIGRLRRRIQERTVSSWATKHQFEVISPASHYADSVLPDDLRRMPFFSRGSFAKTSNVMSREEGVTGRTLVFAYQTRRRMSWYGASGIESRGTVVAVYRPARDFPRFQVRPRGLFPWVDGGTIGERVTLVSDSRFSSEYELHGDEPRNLRARFGETITRRIAEKPGWILQGEGQWIAAAYFDRSENLMSLKTSTLRSASLDQLADHVAQAVALLDQVAGSAARDGRCDVSSVA